MNWQDDIIPRNKFYSLLKGLMVLSILFLIWFTLDEVRNLSAFFDQKNPDHSIEFNGLVLSASTDTLNQFVLYVTIKELEFYSESGETRMTLSQNSGTTKMLGLLSYPSFKINDHHHSFWKSQYTLNILLYAGSLIAATILGFFFVQYQFKQKEKLFTKEIKYLVAGFCFGSYLIFFLKMILYGRMISFLNTEFYLGESIIGGVDNGLLLLGLALTFLLIFLERAIPIQQEQDLTV